MDNVLKVLMYDDFVPDETYYIDIVGTTLEFKAAGNKARDVTELVFTADTALVGKNDAIQFVLLNAAGVYIIETVLKDINGSIEFSTVDTNKAFITDKTIYFYTLGDKATVDGKFTFYDPVDDENAFVNVEAQFTVGSETKKVKLNQSIPVIEKPLEIKVADEHYAIVTNTKTGALTGVKQGATSFLLFYTDDYGEELLLLYLSQLQQLERLQHLLLQQAMLIPYYFI